MKYYHNSTRVCATCKKEILKDKEVSIIGLQTRKIVQLLLSTTTAQLYINFI